MAAPKEERTVEIIVNGQKAFASLKEMNAAAAVLYSQFQKMSGDDPGRAKLVADYQGLKGKIADVKTELTGVSQGAGVMKQAFANAFALFTGGGILGLVQQVFGFLSSAKDEFQGSAKASADLEATLLATKNAAGLTAAEIRAIGEARAKVTLFDDDETNRASAMLLTFKNVKKGVFEDAIPAIQDLATKMGGDGPADMKGASIQLGKALNAPLTGITALTRVGVTFTDQQKEQIAAMVKAGDVAGAQRVILAELNSEFGGSAEAARKAAGGMATLTMRWGEMKETVGGVVSGVLNDFSQWLGRVLDEAQPLVDLLADIGAEFATYYREVMDVVEGMGLFSEKTDTAKIVVEVLKTALTLLIMPFRAVLQVSKAVVDTFIDWYNKSELLRGVIGGLAAVVTSTFKAIKDDAIKYLGGVGDILVGIFTLDKDRILKGFRSTMEATADLALGQGERAANAFMTGYEANKNNKIVRSVSVETSETTKSGGGAPVGGGEEPAGESAKDKKAREALEKKRLAALEKAHKAEAEAEIRHQQMLINLAEAALIAKGTQRERELGAITFDAQRKALTVKGTEAEKHAAIALIEAEAQVKKQELQARFDEEDRAQRQQHLVDLLADEDAAEVEREADFAVQFEEALLNQQQYDQAIYDAKHASLEAKLALEEQYGSTTSKLYRATYKELQKLERDKNKEDLEDARKTSEAKRQMAMLGLKTAGDVVQTTIDLLFQDEAARKKHHNLYTALAGAKIIQDGVQEVAAIWSYSAAQAANVPTAGLFGTILGGVQTALAVARTAFGLSQLQKFSFAQGGRTGGGMMMGSQGMEQGGGMVVSPVGQLMEMSGIRVGSNGKLIDDTGFAVAGIVHQDEYVVPAWMRKDPEVAAVENWLEARRLRGFADGGATTGAASLPVPNPLPETEADLNYAVQVQMLAVLRSLETTFGDVRQWQRELKVHQNLQEVRSGLDTLKRVEQESAIRA
ncbi:hypothetical protein [Hymenobacter sp.]|uniref:hypothetical protein n=1 Tax=Hymenobacter sp. TaxID=1898978 RepID=UPI00286C493B|nr:hypothetical protein [Hymenobacter sp.]